MRAVGRTIQGPDADRSGAATVELCVCLPLLLSLFFGAIETSEMIFLDQSLSVVAYEGARVGVRPLANSGEVRTCCQNLLAARNIFRAAITLNPPDVSTLASGDQFQITISASHNDNAVVPPWLFPGRVISSQVTMVKE